MTRLQVVVEGQTEERFVKITLAPHLLGKEIYAVPTLIETSRTPAGKKFGGGMSSWGKILENLSKFKKNRSAWVTTMFDFYGFPDEHPGAHRVRAATNTFAKAQEIESTMRRQFEHPRFIPFVMVHEFEALVFADSGKAANILGAPGLQEIMDDILRAAGGAEQVNDGEDTHPKARLQNAARNYHECVDGPDIVHEIGMEVLKAKCPRFGKWVQRLENLQP